MPSLRSERLLHLVMPTEEPRLAGLVKSGYATERLRLADDRLHVLLDLGAAHDDPLHAGNVVGAHHVLEDALVHAHRGAEHARAHVGDIRQFEQTLDRSVLAEGAVQDGEEHIQVGDLDVLLVADGVQTGVTRLGEDDGMLERTGLVLFQCFEHVLTDKPVPGVRDADGEDLVPGGIQRTDNRARRHERDLMFAGTTAKKNCHAKFTGHSMSGTPIRPNLLSSRSPVPISCRTSRQPSAGQGRSGRRCPPRRCCRD